MDLVLWINPNFGQGGRGSKNPKILWTSFMYGPQKCRSIKASDLNPRCHDDVAIMSISQVITLMWFSLVLRLNARLEYSTFQT